MAPVFTVSRSSSPLLRPQPTSTETLPGLGGGRGRRAGRKLPPFIIPVLLHQHRSSSPSWSRCEDGETQTPLSSPFISDITHTHLKDLDLTAAVFIENSMHLGRVT